MATSVRDSIASAMRGAAGADHVVLRRGPPMATGSAGQREGVRASLGRALARSEGKSSSLGGYVANLAEMALKFDKMIEIVSAPRRFVRDEHGRVTASVPDLPREGETDAD